MYRRACVTALVLGFACLAGASDVLQVNTDHFVVGIAQLQVGALARPVCALLSSGKGSHAYDMS